MPDDVLTVLRKTEHNTQTATYLYIFFLGKYMRKKRQRVREIEKKKKAITVFRPRSSPDAAAISRPVVMIMYPPQVAVANAAPKNSRKSGNE